MYRIELTSAAKRHLKQISKLKTRRSIAIAIEELKKEPYIGKPLRDELKGFYSYKIDVYRIVYKPYKKDKKILVIRVRHRSDAYN
jgi:mRNA interferase RelE/StbE